MHRVGADAADAPALAARVTGSRSLTLGGFWTHFAIADEPDDAFTAAQIDRFEAALAAVRAAGASPAMLHAANSAGGSRTRAAATTSSAVASPATVTLLPPRSGGCSPGSPERVGACGRRCR